MPRRDELNNEQDDGPLPCPACGYDLAGLLPDEKAAAKCPECWRRVITRKEVRKYQRQQNLGRPRARRWLVIGLMQGAIAAIFIVLHEAASGLAGSFADLASLCAVVVVPVSIVVAGFCGGLCTRNSRTGAGKWRVILGVVTFLLAWIPITLFTFVVLASLLNL